MAIGEKLTKAERQQRYRDRRNILTDSADLKPLTLRGAKITPAHTNMLTMLPRYSARNPHQVHACDRH